MARDRGKGQGQGVEAKAPDGSPERVLADSIEQAPGQPPEVGRPDAPLAGDVVGEVRDSLPDVPGRGADDLAAAETDPSSVRQSPRPTVADFAAGLDENLDELVLEVSDAPAELDWMSRVAAERLEACAARCRAEWERRRKGIRKGV